MYPVLLHVGPYTIYTYGVFVMLGVGVLIATTYLLAREAGWNWGRFLPVMAGVLVGGVFGGRLSQLLVESQTRLLVFATCRALLPAVELATVANIVASEQDVTGQQTAAWAECFFGLLAKGRSVYKAFELARLQVDTPMRLVRQADMAFTLGKSRGAAQA